MTSEEGAMREIPCDITDPLGLHIQLAVLLASEAQRWRSKVELDYAGHTINAKELLEIMALGVRNGEHIVVRVDGVDEATASEAIERLMITF